MHRSKLDRQAEEANSKLTRSAVAVLHELPRSRRDLGLGRRRRQHLREASELGFYQEDDNVKEPESGDHQQQVETDPGLASRGWTVGGTSNADQPA